ncbi:vWA domain-containing protein [Pseudoxanthomonas indica]|uniref:Ca-activated chloride channel family protein n=1 Tax=Pseudoxanthomonas indica TaxID=428993 RepID=A0A1T5LVC0_9GAMM|nr:VWA domain-containing protein [Pseudoxanthomonas indica]GGD39933.1 hypothetical protein GCM10007235_10030 [Pseudoxanthomonas indica]SKC79795.1 Ca-activated chloride channel family protein [Pseudoxanthomonas indica]
MRLTQPCLALLACALLVACQSQPRPADAPSADAAAAASQAATTLESVDARAEAYARSSADMAARRARSQNESRTLLAYAPPPPAPPAPGIANTENYAGHDDNPVHRTREQAVSTFSVDVDTGSYSNVRRMLRQGVRPPADSVRAEELINYFDYGHPGPGNREQPFRVSTELAPAPWNAQRQLLMIGIKGYDVPKATLPPANLVFLIDTSGSMESEDKLPLLKQAFAQLTRQLRAQDRVSIVVYAGSAGLVLPPTPGDRQDTILAALDRLQAGGSTNGGDGIRLAYSMARQAFAKEGVNRVILATDGDFNVGIIDREALKTLVADQRKSGIALSTLGFGAGNYNDAMAEELADVGDGNHAYIDTLQEARKVLVDEMQSTLLTIARDVKIQIEFNPAMVAEYRLIGYENRVLKDQDFANDKVDAGDIGAGHEVTALYEITPVGSHAPRLPALRYGEPAAISNKAGVDRNELAHLRLRYKLPAQDRSQLIEAPIAAADIARHPSARFRFASAVAAYADLLRGGKNIDSWQWDDVRRAAEGSMGEDRFGLRREFVQLVDSARQITAAASSDPQIAEVR